MKNYTTEFIEEFRKTERIIQQIEGTATTFRDMELNEQQSGDSELAAKMQVCRILRNYITHHPDADSFIPIPKDTYLQLQKIRMQFEEKIMKVKEQMIRVKALSMKDNLIYAADRIVRYPVLPVIDDEGNIIGLFTTKVLCQCVANELSLKTKLGRDTVKLERIQNAAYISPEMCLKDIEKGKIIFLVTDDGKPEGKYKGMLIRTGVADE